MNKFYTIQEVQDNYRLSRSTVYRLINDGAFPLVKIGRASRISVADVEAWANQLPHVNVGLAA